MLEQVTIKFPLWSQLDLDKILKNRNKKQFFLENDLITEPSVHWLYFDRYTSNLPYYAYCMTQNIFHVSLFTLQILVNRLSKFVISFHTEWLSTFISVNQS